MKNSFNLVFGNLKIQHINYIYQDAEKHANIMELIFKMPKFEFSEDLDHPAIYRGRDTEFSIKMGVSRCFNTSIEIFEWIKGDSVYKEFVDTQKEGLHHFGVFVENLEECVDYLQKQGIEIIQTGMFPPRLKYAYMDTVKIFGVVIEFCEIVKRKRKN